MNNRTKHLTSPGHWQPSANLYWSHIWICCSSSVYLLSKTSLSSFSLFKLFLYAAPPKVCNAVCDDNSKNICPFWQEEEPKGRGKKKKRRTWDFGTINRLCCLTTVCSLIAASKIYNYIHHCVDVSHKITDLETSPQGRYLTFASFISTSEDSKNRKRTNYQTKMFN